MGNTNWVVFLKIHASEAQNTARIKINDTHTKNSIGIGCLLHEDIII